MRNQAVKPMIWLGLLILLIGLACNLGSSAKEATPTSPPPPTKQPQPTATTEEKVEPVAEPTKDTQTTQSGEAVSSLQDVENAVVQIEAEGTFIDPEFGWQVNAAGRGTGFIIDPSGIAVTNNHVVTGAAILRVWLKGEDAPRNAKVLGVSECSDLAVIKIDGEDFPYLDWYDGEPGVGTQVYAAGFPLGDPEFTLTDGIISKSEAGGETNWASVDTVIEHTAKINPGNSGGPLVDANGKAIGINYASVQETDQNFSISKEKAIPIIEKLKNGEDVDSIGINGIAVSGNIGDTPISGIWVQSVASGSPANKADILPGDILYMVENEVLALDGTMADYCDILRSRSATDTMGVTVIRWNDLTLHEGQINGDKLAYVGDLGSTATSPNEPTSTNCSVADTAGYIGCVDDTSTIYVEVPDTWGEFNGSEWTLDNDVIGVAISAAPVLDDFNNFYDADGVFFGASDTFAQWGGYIEFLDIYSEGYKESCKFDGRYDYDDGFYRGAYDAFVNCGGQGGTDAYVLAAVPKDDPTASMIMILIQVQAGETDIVEHIWSTFVVTY